MNDWACVVCLRQYAKNEPTRTCFDCRRYQAWGAIVQLLKGSGQDDEWLGLGCRVSIGAVVNRLVRVELIVQLRDAAYLDDTDALRADVVQELQRYFDERPDFWTFRAGSLRGVVAAVDRRRILGCTLASVREN